MESSSKAPVAPALRLAVIPAEAVVAPGGQISLTLTIENAGPTAQECHISTVGVPASWYDLAVSSLTLPAASTRQVLLAVHPPDVAATGGKYPFKVQVTPDGDGAVALSTIVALRVGSAAVGSPPGPAPVAGAAAIPTAAAPAAPGDATAPSSPPRSRALPVRLLVLIPSLLLVVMGVLLFKALAPATAPGAAPVPSATAIPLAQPAPTGHSVLGALVRVLSIRRFTLVRGGAGQPYRLVWQTANAATVTLDGRPVPAQGSLALSLPIHDTTYVLVARNGAVSTMAQVRVVVRAAPAPGPQSVVLTLPRIVELALRQTSGGPVVAWRVEGATRVAVEGRQVASRGEAPVPAGLTVVHFSAGNAVGTEQRVLRVPPAGIATSSAPTATGVPPSTPVPGATDTPVPTATPFVIEVP